MEMKKCFCPPSVVHITQQGELYILETATKVVQKENLKCEAEIIFKSGKPVLISRSCSAFDFLPSH